MKKIEETILSLSNEEKIMLTNGHNFMFTNENKRLEIPSIRMSDGPHGLRVQDGSGDNGVTSSKAATCFPTAVTLANTRNPDLIKKMGNALAEEAKHYKIDVILGPGVNIKRNPLCGRNFEYFSEDPYLAGKLAGSEVVGIQEKGISSCVKHFALNNSENYRFIGNSICDIRAIREIYLKQFEYIVKDAKPDLIMSSYNRINGVYSSENSWLLNDVLRKEWGFDGVCITDWGGTHNRVNSLQAGVDIDMPGDTPICQKEIYEGLKKDKTLEKDLDKTTYNILKLVEKHSIHESYEADFKGHHELAKDLALEGAVLLKNEDSVLPLKESENIIIVGELFDKMRYQGSGSSMINPYFYKSIKDSFNEHNIKFKYVKGYKEKEISSNKELIQEAVKESKNYDKIVLFLGLTDYVEGEGGDRENMSLPQNQIDLVNELIKENKKIVVVLFGGSPIELPFYDNINGLLNMFLSGQNGGEATYELLFGKTNPSGKLAETWPLTYKDVPFGEEFAKNKTDIYKESIFVGYRYYLSKNKEVRFPFGYGLSYTKFEYSDLNIEKQKEGINVSLNVKNIGKMDGKEVVEIYVSSPKEKLFKPIRELKGFKKLNLKRDEVKNIDIFIQYSDLKSYLINENRFVLENGNYNIEIGKSSNEIVMSKSIFVEGEIIEKQYDENVYNIYEELDFDKVNDDIFKKMSNIEIEKDNKPIPITLESRLTDLNYTFFGKIIIHAILNVAKKDMKKAKKMKEGIEKENKIKGALFLKRILESNSIISLSMSSSGAFPYNVACGIVEISNGRILKGIKKIRNKIKPLTPNKEK